MANREKLILSNGVRVILEELSEDDNDFTDLRGFLNYYDFLTMDEDGSIYGTKDKCQLPQISPANILNEEEQVWILNEDTSVMQDGQRDMYFVGDVDISGFIKSVAKSNTSLTALNNRALDMAHQAGFKDCKLVRLP